MGKAISKGDIHQFYRTKEVLGKGSFASVKLATRISDGKSFAVKVRRGAAVRGAKGRGGGAARGGRHALTAPAHR
jgi:hypothetical protein